MKMKPRSKKLGAISLLELQQQLLALEEDGADAYEQLLYVWVLLSRDLRDGWAIASYETYAKRMGVSRATVYRRMRLLVRRKSIQAEPIGMSGGSQGGTWAWRRKPLPRSVWTALSAQPNP